MKYYLRKIDDQCIKKQISISKKIWTGFFNDDEEIIINGVKSGSSSNVTILTATDPRLGGGIKKIIRDEGGMNSGEILLFKYIGKEYFLEIIRMDDNRFECFSGMFDDERHILIESEKNHDAEVNNVSTRVKGGFNKIYYGIPGCGKSYKIKAMLKHYDGFRDEAIMNGIKNSVDDNNIINTTFYLDYTYSDFVGQIYPKVTDKDVSYEFVPGPFTKALLKAYTTDEMVYLVIDEINRGNAAAIFGDLFQLLDRLEEDGSNKTNKFAGDSVYSISNEMIEGYFEQYNKKIDSGEIEGPKVKLDNYKNNIYIPSNLTIFATMNTSDQNVFPLDTAFKRRWDRERISVDEEWSNVPEDYKTKYIPNTNVKWIDFVQTVNKQICEEAKKGVITEDKQIGPYFISSKLLSSKEENKNSSEERNKQNRLNLIKFVNNVVDYLYNDVSKFNHETLFNKNVTLDDIYKAIDDYDVSMSNENVFDLKMKFDDQYFNGEMEEEAEDE